MKTASNKHSNEKWLPQDARRKGGTWASYTIRCVRSFFCSTAMFYGPGNQKACKRKTGPLQTALACASRTRSKIAEEIHSQVDLLLAFRQTKQKGPHLSMQAIWLVLTNQSEVKVTSTWQFTMSKATYLPIHRLLYPREPLYSESAREFTLFGNFLSGVMPLYVKSLKCKN
jgi:hypothetical protein